MTKLIMNVLTLTIILLTHVSFSDTLSDPSTDGLNGVWGHRQIFCRTMAKDGQISRRTAKLVDIDPAVFYPDIELTISSSDSPGAVPNRYVEKAVLQSSCKLNDMAKMSKQDSQIKYFWSKNKVHIVPESIVNGVVYNRMQGQLIDHNVNYSQLSSCGALEDKIKISGFGIFATIGAFLNYDSRIPDVLRVNYFKAEATRLYHIYLYQHQLYLEFKDKNICTQPEDTAVMVFSKKSI